MIRLFRKVRMNLWQGTNMTKYIIYAIFEVILVVVGILLAVQINIMYEDHKDQIQASIYLTDLKSDL